MPATATLEHFTVTMEGARIDKAARVIYDVKLNGNRSRNKRWYSDDVLKAATHLYEGVKVYLDHSDPGRSEWSGAPRSVSGCIGTIKNPKFMPGGTRGELHVLPSKVAFMDDVEAQPKVFGMSHVADTSSAPTSNDSGEEVITQIHEIFSVDVVTEPACTRGMFESKKDTKEQEDRMSVEKYEAELKRRAESAEGKVTENEKTIASLTEENKGLKGELEATKTLLKQEQAKVEAATKEATDAKAKVTVAEESVKKSEITRLCAEAGLDAEVAKSLHELKLEAATSIIAKLKDSVAKPGRTTGKPTSEGKPTPPKGGKTHETDDADLDAALMG